MSIYFVLLAIIVEGKQKPKVWKFQPISFKFLQIMKSGISMSNFPKTKPENQSFKAAFTIHQSLGRDSLQQDFLTWGPWTWIGNLHSYFHKPVAER